MKPYRMKKEKISFAQKNIKMDTCRVEKTHFLPEKENEITQKSIISGNFYISQMSASIYCKSWGIRAKINKERKK